MKRILAAFAVTGLVGLGALAAPAAADPITCPNGQESTKTADGWDCVNRGGNESNAEDPKNPNADKDDF